MSVSVQGTVTTSVTGGILASLGGAALVGGIAYLIWRAGQVSASVPATVPGTVPGTVPATQPGTQPGTVPGTVPAGPLTATACFDAPPLVCATAIMVPQYGLWFMEITGTPGDVVALLVSSVNASGAPACDFSSATMFGTIPSSGTLDLIQKLTVFGYYYYVATDAAGYCSNGVFVQTQGEPPPQVTRSCGCDSGGRL